MILCFCMLAGQTPQTAPLNPEYVRYLELKEHGLWKRTTEEGYALGYIPSPIKFAISDTGLKEIKDLPSSFDLRNVNGQSYLTQIKDQGNCGSCWTFGTLAAIESWLLMQDEGHYNLSENHMKQNHGFAWGPCDGGNYYLSTAYLSRGSGSILEADAPYYDYNHSTYNGNPPVMYHTDAVFLPNNENIIKQAIMEHGALYTIMHWADGSYNSVNFTYYYHGSDNPNHAVNLVGWDDNKQTAGGTGAWIVRNSWGTNWGESGYFYIAYQDTRANSAVGYWPNKIEYSSNRVIDYSDHLGSTSSFGYGANTGYALIKFTPAKDHELLTLGTYIVASGATVGFEVYDNFNNGSLSSLLGSIPNQTFDHAGYVTLELPIPVDVSAGNDFYIKVYYNTPGYNWPIPIEAEWNDYSYPTIDYGVSWVSSNGTSWTQIGGGTNWPYNLCVKTYGVAPADEGDPEQNTITFNVKDQNNQPVSDAKITITPASSKTITGMNTLNNTQSNTPAANTSPPLNRQGYIDIAAFDYAPQNQSNDTPKSDSPEVILPGNWAQANAVGTYRWVDGDGNPLGWIFGNNTYGDTGTGMHFNVQETHTIVGAYFWIGAAASGSGNVHFRMYDFNGAPGAVIASKTVALNNVAAFPTGEGVTPDQFPETFYVEFDNPVTVHGDFFVGVDFSGLSWNTHGDGIGMASTLVDQGGGGLDRAWIKGSDGIWVKATSYDAALDLDVGVFPIIQTDAEPIILYTDANGLAVADLAEGQYSYLVEKEGYSSESGTFILTGQDKTIEVQLSGDMAPPFGLLVETEGLNPGEALFSWNNVLETALFEDFEGGEIPDGWDRIITNTSTDGPVPGTWTVNDYASTDVSPFGTYHAGLWWDYGHQDEWLISPEVYIEPGFELEFWSAVFLGSTHADHYYVKVSTDGGNSWSVLWDASAESGGWNYYSSPFVLDLGDYNGQHVHISFNAVDGPTNDGLWYIWFIDNVAIGPEGDRNTIDISQFERMSRAVEYAEAAVAPDMVARDRSALTMPADVVNTGKAFLGFNVFLNEAMVAEEIEETQYLFTDLPSGEHTAGVQSVYTSGSSDIVTIDFEITLGADEVMLHVAIMDEFGEPVEGAGFEIGHFGQHTSDAGGNISLSVSPGTYNYTVTKTGFETYSGTIVITTAPVQQLDISLTYLRFNVVLDVNIEEAGNVSGGGEYHYGETAEINAYANEGYYFLHWLENDQMISTSESYSFAVFENRNITAVFDEIQEDSVVDIDGNVYTTVIIGNQEWMAENLKTTTYNNGADIPNVTGSNTWINLITGAYAWYDNDIENDHYGALYNWYAVIDPAGLCPEGWRIPSADDWKQLRDYISENYPDIGIGQVLKSCRQVNSPLGGECATTEHPRWNASEHAYGSDESGFSALPGGMHLGSSLLLGQTGQWWSSAPYSGTHAVSRQMEHSNDLFRLVNMYKYAGLSVRCVRDVEDEPPLGDNIMIIHDIDAFAGEIITVELEIVNEDEFAGFNLDIPLPAGFDYIEGSAQLFRDDGHFFDFDILPGNVARMLSASVPTKPFLGNDGVIVSFDLQTPDEEGTYVLNIVDAVIADAQGNDIMTGAEPGTVTLEETIIEEYTLTIHIAGSGNVEVNGVQYTAPVAVEEGTVLGLEAIANTGWEFDGWSGDLTGDASTANITMDEDKNITATFAEIPPEEHIITATAGPGGSITPSGDVSVTHGENQSFSIAPDTGYEIDDVLVDGESTGPVTSYTFVNVTGNHTIHAEFALITYAVTFNVNMKYVTQEFAGFDFDPDNDVVYITGDMFDWAVPGSDPENQTMEHTGGGSTVYTRTLNLAPGSYEYLYYLNEGWGGSEWYGDLRREIVVSQSMVANDWFGSIGDPTDLLLPGDDVSIRVYPIPARNILIIESGVRMTSVHMIDVLGQRIMSETVNDVFHEVSVSGLKEGLYFLQVQTPWGIKTLRVQVVK